MKIEQMSEEEREEIVQYGLKRGKIILLSTIVTIIELFGNSDFSSSGKYKSYFR